MLYLLTVPVVVLGFSAVAVLLDTVNDVSILNPGAHGLSEVVYAYTSAAQQQRLGVRRADRATPTGSTRPSALSMLVGRFVLIVLVLALAGALARKQPVPRLGGHVPDRHAPLHRPARRRDPRRRRPHLHPDARARADPGAPAAVTTKKPASLFDPAIVRQRRCSPRSGKLDPRHVARNPVMFLVEVGSVVVTVLFVKDVADASTQENLFAGLIAAWLWFTVLFANFAEAMAEGRGKAQAAALRRTRSETLARRRLARRADRRGAELAAHRRRRRRRHRRST